MKKFLVFLLAIIVVANFSSIEKAEARAITPFDYELIYQSPYPANLAPGEVANVWIEVKNTGTVTWNRDGIINVVRLGSGSAYGEQHQKRDYVSEFANSDWLSGNRPTAVFHPEVRPGWHTRFQFNIKAPSNNGTYKAYFAPVVEGVEWMKDIGIYWQITVGSGSGAPANNEQAGADITVSSIALTPGSSVSVRSGSIYDFSLVANYSDGSTQTITDIASWEVVYGSGTGTMHTGMPGRFIAGGLGTCWVKASFGGKSVTSDIVTVTGL